MRRACTILHRWIGLAIAGFLFVSGMTGAVISWDHELDELLNPHLTEARTEGAALPSLDLVRLVEARDPRLRVASFPFAVEPGEAMSISIRPVVDPATGRLHDLGFNQVFLDPATGAQLGTRAWGAAWPISRETFVSFLYKLHYSLHLPEMWGIDLWGRWLLGMIAILWTIDCFIGFCLTLPVRRWAGHGRGWWSRWNPAWQIKGSGSRYRIAFDIHRALGLWLWAVLLTIAFTAFSLNLYREVFYPLMSLVSQVTPNMFSEKPPAGRHQPIEPALGYGDIVDRARAESARKGWTQPMGSAFYTPGFGIYGVRFHHPGADHGAAGVGPAILYFNGRTGSLLGARQPWTGTGADIFLQAQFPLHSGRILGLPGRILISVMGLVVAALSVTGVVIWYRKRCARLAVRRSREERASFAPTE
jgi:uncharacterized iron-regulated membrane protein